MVRRGELTDEAWGRIAPLLPENGRPGGRWRCHREVVNGILWKLRTGAPWRDLPSRYGPWQTCYEPLRPLAAGRHLGPPAGPRADEVGRRGRGRVAGERGQHHGARTPACRRRPSQAESGGRKKGVAHPEDEALGRSRGGLSTKVHLSCDGRGRPLSVVLTAGQRHEAPQLAPLLDAIRVARPGGVGRPRKRPDHLLADRGYAFPSCRLMLRRRGIRHTIPERRDQRERREGRPGRPPDFDAVLYARRNVVERCVGRLKQWRGVATRYQKRAVNYRAMVVIAALVIWLTA